MSFLRTIEKRIRRTTLNALGTSGRIGPEDSLAIPLPEKPRILLVRIDRIGDAIISTPVLNSLRKRFPQGRIDILLGEKNRTVAPLLPAIDNVYVLAKKASGMLRTVAALRRNRYDLVVNLHLNRSASASTVAGLVRAGIVIESPQENAFAGNQDHTVTMTARLLKPLGIEAITTQNERENPLHIELPDQAVINAERVLRDLRTSEPAQPNVDFSEGFILINVSASHLSRHLPREQVIELATELCREKMTPIICGVPGDAERVQEIAMASGGAALPPLQNYGTFAAVVARAGAVITPDTSTVHLAAALGRPTLGLYGSERMAQGWRPWGVRHSVLLNSEGIEKIQSEEVAAALRQLLQFETNEGHSDTTARTEISTRSV